MKPWRPPPTGSSGPSDRRSPTGTPRPSRASSLKQRGTIEVAPGYADGLEGGLDGFSHIYLLYHFHRVNGFSLRQRPFADGSRERGIFAIRHCNRPNPIGISLVEVIAVEGSTVRVRGIDVLDGTPLLDIKPYVRQFDHRDEVRSGWVDARRIAEVKVRSFSPKDLREYEESA